MQDSYRRNEARQYFKDCGLSYQDINLSALRYLEIELNDQFLQVAKRCMQGTHYDSHGGRKPQYWVRINPAKYYKGRWDPYTDALICAQLTATGTYFTCRDVVTFNPNGLIGFASEADDINVQPVLTAFRIWCDWLVAQKEARA